MTIAPIRHSVFVPVPPARAFALFTTEMARWWPQRSCAEQSEQVVAVALEPGPGGRWFRRYDTGREADLGSVRLWDPPDRLVLGWQVDATMTFDPALLTEVELRFEPAEGGTQVLLEHRDLHRFGDSARDFAQRIEGGWRFVLGGYAALAGEAAERVA